MEGRIGEGISDNRGVGMAGEMASLYNLHSEAFLEGLKLRLVLIVEQFRKLGYLGNHAPLISAERRIILGLPTGVREGIFDSVKAPGMKVSRGKINLE